MAGHRARQPEGRLGVTRAREPLLGLEEPLHGLLAVLLARAFDRNLPVGKPQVVDGRSGDVLDGRLPLGDVENVSVVDDDGAPVDSLEQLVLRLPEERAADRPADRRIRIVLEPGHEVGDDGATLGAAGLLGERARLLEERECVALVALVGRRSA